MMRLTINGKFLGATLNGVHRTAGLYAEALLRRRDEGLDVEVLAPRAAPADPSFRTLAPRVLPSRFGSGQFWEMLALPIEARGRVLLNLCNLGPIVHPRSVVMIHDAQTFLWPKDYSGRQALAYRLLLPAVARCSRRILTVSEFARRSLVEHGIAPEEKIAVVHNGGDHLMRTPLDAAALTRHGLSRGGYALALGSIKRYKNIELLFRVFDHAEFAGFPLVIAGGPPATAYAAADWRPPPATRFLASVSDATLRALYSGAAMFLFPSRTEGFGLPPLEAMSCGCPVVAARAGAIPEICGGGALLVDPEDTEGWRNAVRRLREPERAGAFAEAAAERVRHFTWRRAGERLWEAIKDLAY